MPKKNYRGAFGKGYVIIWGSPGYMPDGGMWAENWGEALESAYDELDHFADLGWQMIGEPDFDYTEEQIEEAIAEAKSDLREDGIAYLDRDIFGTEYMEIADSEEEPKEGEDFWP